MIDKYVLVKPDIKYKKGFDAFYKNYKNSGEEMVPFVLKFYKDSFEEYIKMLNGFPSGIGVPEEFVEHSTFWMKDSENKILGVANIRHRLNEQSLQSGGHIGYGVAPMYRGFGYATEMLRLAIFQSRKMGISDILITCNKNNLPSAKVIMKNGGILDPEYNIERNIIQRYWIRAK
jgi:predicted acetyltransferase